MVDWVGRELTCISAAYLRGSRCSGSAWWPSFSARDAAGFGGSAAGWPRKARMMRTPPASRDLGSRVREPFAPAAPRGISDSEGRTGGSKRCEPAADRSGPASSPRGPACLCRETHPRRFKFARIFRIRFVESRQAVCCLRRAFHRILPRKLPALAGRMADLWTRALGAGNLRGVGTTGGSLLREVSSVDRASRQLGSDVLGVVRFARGDAS
jgi:hypothetical protein